jgi:hypothetical protein
MTRLETIKEKYWIEFLKWYKDYDEAMLVARNSFEGQVQSVDDLFWYWLTHERANQSGNDFLDKL